MELNEVVEARVKFSRGRVNYDSRLISIVKQLDLIVVLQLQQLKCLKRAIDE